MTETEIQHDSDCAQHNEPAYPNGPCDCSARDALPPNTQITQENADEVPKGAMLRRTDAGWVANTDRPALSPPAEGEAMARRFHEAYERLAPSFGYATRDDTKAFDPKTPNGRLMIAVCNEIATPRPTPADHIGDATEKVDWNVVGPKLVEDISRQLTFERGYGDVRGELLFRCKDLIVAILSEQPCAYLVDAHKGEGEECLVPAAQGDPGSFPVFARAATQPEGK